MFGGIRSLRAHMCSMKKLLALVDEFDVIYPGHGPFPLGGEIIERLIDGAGRILGGEVEGSDPPFEMPAKLYRAGGAAFFYDGGDNR